MKRFLTVLSALILIIGVLVTGLLALRDFKDSVKLAEMEEEIEAAGKQAGVDAKEIFKGMMKNAGIEVSSSQLMIAGLVTAVTTLLVLAALVLIFMAQPDKSKMVGLAVIVFAIIMIFVNPSFETGPYGGPDSRTLAMVAGAFAVVGALGSLAVIKLRQKEAS